MVMDEWTKLLSPNGEGKIRLKPTEQWTCKYEADLYAKEENERSCVVFTTCNGEIYSWILKSFTCVAAQYYLPAKATLWNTHLHFALAIPIFCAAHPIENGIAVSWDDVTVRSSENYIVV